ncbi:Pet127-domain-containing protein [Panus rudis PR-1116 ss-1]|nr:Pet127-domain-containing protein [Panus rudis PR-1116 ss-1]
MLTCRYASSPLLKSSANLALRLAATASSSKGPASDVRSRAERRREKPKRKNKSRHDGSKQRKKRKPALWDDDMKAALEASKIGRSVHGIRPPIRSSSPAALTYRSPLSHGPLEPRFLSPDNAYFARQLRLSDPRPYWKINTPESNDPYANLLRKIPTANVVAGASNRAMTRAEAKRKKREEVERMFSGANGELSLNTGEHSTSLQNEWPSENWKDDWGADKLVPDNWVPPKAAATKNVKAFARDKRLDDSGPPHLGSPFSGTDVGNESLPYYATSYQRVVEGTISPSNNEVITQDLVPPSPQRPVAKLAHGLERVLFNPGVHWVQDFRTRVYNFNPWLQEVPKVVDFAFDRVGGFIKSSRDMDLRTLAQREGAKFVGSTSSLSGMLSQLYFLISSMKPTNTSMLSTPYANLAADFTPGQRLPVSVLLHYKDGVYATDSDPSDPGMQERNVLTWMGTMLENFLTHPPEEFETLLRKNTPPAKEPDNRREAYRYSKFGSYVMRSQLDCHDSRLPGTGVFDIKTRAALPIRMDLFNIEENSGYLIYKQHGVLESFEREYYDLIRSAFLKYNFQARIGNMDGIFAAYHNTAQMFGFQYIPLEDIDEALFGVKGVGDQVFEMCLSLLEAVSHEITHHLPEQDISCLWYTEDDGSVLHVWAEPVDWDARNGPQPIVQLDITTNNLINGSTVPAQNAIPKISKEHWSVHFKIQTAQLDFMQIRQNRQVVRNEQLKYWALPSGMDMQQFARHWATGMDWGQTGNTSQEFTPSRFKAPDGRVEYMRGLARRGRKMTEKMSRSDAGKPKVVLGGGDGKGSTLLRFNGQALDLKETLKEYLDEMAVKKSLRSDGGNKALLDGLVEILQKTATPAVQAVDQDEVEADVPTPAEVVQLEVDQPPLISEQDEDIPLDETTSSTTSPSPSSSSSTSES